MPRAAAKAAIGAIVAIDNRIAMAVIRRTTAEEIAAVMNRYEATEVRVNSRNTATKIRDASRNTVTGTRDNSKTEATRTRDASRNTVTGTRDNSRFVATANRVDSRNTVTGTRDNSKTEATANRVDSMNTAIKIRDANRNGVTGTRDNSKTEATANRVDSRNTATKIRDANRNTVTGIRVSEGREMTASATEIQVFGPDTTTNEAAAHDRTIDEKIAAMTATIANTGQTGAGKTNGHAGTVVTRGHLFGPTGITIGRPGTDTLETRENIKRKFTRTIASSNAGDTMPAGTDMKRTARVGTAAMASMALLTIRRMSTASEIVGSTIIIMIKTDRISDTRVIGRVITARSTIRGSILTI